MLVPKRRLLIVTLALPGDRPSEVGEWAAEFLSEELGCRADLHPAPIQVSKKLFHSSRAQGDAVALLGEVEHLVSPQRAVLAITEYDLHSPLRRELPFAMGARKGWAGLLSTYRMEDKSEPANTMLRLQKMLYRYGAELVCDAPRQDDITSVLHQSLVRPEELDLMHWPPTLHEGGSAQP